MHPRADSRRVGVAPGGLAAKVEEHAEELVDILLNAARRDEGRVSA